TQRGFCSVSSFKGGGHTRDATSGANPSPGLSSTGFGLTAGGFSLAYSQLARLYWLINPLNGHSATPPFAGSRPEKAPSKSSVSLKSSLRRVAAFVYFA